VSRAALAPGFFLVREHRNIDQRIRELTPPGSPGSIHFPVCHWLCQCRWTLLLASSPKDENRLPEKTLAEPVAHRKFDQHRESWLHLMNSRSHFFQKTTGLFQLKQRIPNLNAQEKAIAACETKCRNGKQRMIGMRKSV